MFNDAMNWSCRTCAPTHPHARRENCGLGMHSDSSVRAVGHVQPLAIDSPKGWSLFGCRIPIRLVLPVARYV